MAADLPIDGFKCLALFTESLPAEALKNTIWSFSSATLSTWHLSLGCKWSVSHLWGLRSLNWHPRLKERRQSRRKAIIKNQTKPQMISRNCPFMFHWPVLCHVLKPLVCTDRSSVSSWEYCHTELSKFIHYLKRRKEALKESSQQCLTHGFPISVLMCICARKYTSSIK